MRRHDVIARLKSLEPDIRALGAKALYLYGSYARDEARPDSDVDVFIDKDPARHFGFDEFMDIYFKLQAALGAEVGYTTATGWSISTGRRSSARQSGYSDGSDKQSPGPT